MPSQKTGATANQWDQSLHDRTLTPRVRDCSEKPTLVTGGWPCNGKPGPLGHALAKKSIKKKADKGITTMKHKAILPTKPIFPTTFL